MTLESYLVISALMLTIGMIIYITRKNSIAILLGIELIMNAAALNFVAFSHFIPSKASQLDGQVFAVFIILLAAAEAVVALAIVLALYKKENHIQANELVSLEG